MTRRKKMFKNCNVYKQNTMFSDYITQGTIIRSRVNWYEKGKKNNKYFLNLQKSNKKKALYGILFQVTEQLQLIPKQL